MSKEIKELIEEAGRKAIENRHKGFHCSESTFLAINDVLKITDPNMVRFITGFHGGGGTRRKEPGVDFMAALEAVASGKDRRPSEELPLSLIGHLCGALAAGKACIGCIYGRRKPEDELVCVDELCYELHQRFLKEMGEVECRLLKEKWVPLSENWTCEYIYKRGAELAVELILKAHQVVPECKKFEVKP